jgi:hypothetical protein
LACLVAADCGDIIQLVAGGRRIGGEVGSNGRNFGCCVQNQHGCGAFHGAEMAAAPGSLVTTIIIGGYWAA